jgi:hypothetical protein
MPRRPDLEYLKAVNQAAPPADPQVLFLLMGQYANANLQAEGIEFLSARLREFDPQLNDTQKALYLSAIGLLRAQHAAAVPLLHRIGWVKETIAILDRAAQLSGGQVFVVNWISGLVRAQLPNRFNGARQPRSNCNGASQTLKRRHTQGGCEKSITNWQNSPELRMRRRKPRSICGSAASQTLTGRFC